jgi:hypothetical protein
LFGNVYEQIVPVTTADKAATRDTDVFDMQSTVNAVRTLTLWRSREKDEIFINNRSSFLGVAALHADDTALYGSALILPGQIGHFRSDDAGNWYRVGGVNIGVAQTSLTAAQIISLNSAPIVVVPACGAGRVAIPIGIDIQITRTSTAFANGGVLELRYTDASGALMIATIPAAFVTGAAGVAYVSVNAVVTTATPIVNSPLVLCANGADFITGTGTMKVRTRFSVSDYN